MAKPKYEEKTTLEIIGILNLNNDQELVINVDEDVYLLKDILNEKLGSEVSFKFIIGG